MEELKFEFVLHLPHYPDISQLSDLMIMFPENKFNDNKKLTVETGANYKDRYDKCSRWAGPHWFRISFLRTNYIAPLRVIIAQWA